jgi:hypothetical protein
MSEQLLSVDEAAVRLGSRFGEEVPTRTVRWWCANGYLAGAQRVGRDWVIPAPAVKDFRRPARGKPAQGSKR